MSEVFHPKTKTQGTTHSMDEYHQQYVRSINSNNQFWLEKSQRLDWIKSPTQAGTGDFHTVDFTWFADGKINACYNCVDRHLTNKSHQTALIWAQDEVGFYEYITYQELSNKVCQTSEMLKALGVQKGDRVCIYLPMIPQLVYTVLACARIGAVHSVVFAGFSAEALRGRILDTECKLVITANEGLRGGKTIPLKKITDKALEGIDFVKKVLVTYRTQNQVFMMKDRDLNFDQEMLKYKTTSSFEEMNAEDPLFILYTSGSTGKPKGVLHSTGGYLTYASYTHQEIFGYKQGEIYFCAADIGWVTGHSYIVYGPLANGATTVLFESIPTYPDPGRYWQIIEDLKVNIFYTAPTALRSLAQFDAKLVSQYNLESLRVLGTVGEPINPEVWKWYFEVVGRNKCDIVDTWWQTETGGILISPLAGVTPTKAGSATLPFYGIEPIIVNPESGLELKGNSIEGALCLKNSWPGQARTIFRDHQRFKETYFTQYQGLYFTGDGCRRDEDGYYWITGRIDDVLNVSGHRLGTAEIESALMEHETVAEAAVVGYPHEIKGVGIYAYIITYDSSMRGQELIDSIKDIVREKIGRFAAPDIIHFTLGLPKTRSGKVMRRILRKIAHDEYDQLGDLSTLSDPKVVEDLIKGHKDK